MTQNPQKEKVPSLSANNSNYLLGGYRMPFRTPREKDKVAVINTKLPPISTTAMANSHHPIIFSKPKFPHSSLHVDQSSSGKTTQQNVSRNDVELNDDEVNISSFRKNKITTSSNNAALKNIQISAGSLHMPSSTPKPQETDIKEIKKTLGIETSNDMNNYNKIVKDLEKIIEQTHFPSSIKNSRNNFFDVSLALGSKNQRPSPLKKLPTPNIMSIKTPNKILSPIKMKSPTINFDPNIATSLLFSPSQLLNPEYLPNMEPSKASSKKNGIVKAYSANTHQGLVRNYNEDRVAIILNIMKPPNKKDVVWPLCSYFAIYDGHGGTKCAEFLRDNLHHYVIFFKLG